MNRGPDWLISYRASVGLSKEEVFVYLSTHPFWEDELFWCQIVLAVRQGGMSMIFLTFSPENCETVILILLTLGHTDPISNLCPNSHRLVFCMSCARKRQNHRLWMPIALWIAGEIQVIAHSFRRIPPQALLWLSLKKQCLIIVCQQERCCL